MAGKEILKRTISWITPDYFLDCDAEIIRGLSDYYDIQWHVILPEKDSRYKEEEVRSFESPGVKIYVHKNKYRLRNPLSLVFFFRLINQIKRAGYSVLYLNYTPSPFFTFCTILFLNKSNVIVTAHQGQVHSGFKLQSIYRHTYNLFYSFFPLVNMFSKSEADKFAGAFPSSKVIVTPLALKNYGPCKVSQNSDKIEFLNFGSIRQSKNIKLLINAACSLYEDGIRNFQVSIAGGCDNWEIYENEIKYPEIFKLSIRMIENNEVNEMFCRAHYLVLPYSIVTQSGPLKIAYHYGIPVIASDLPGFRNEIVDGETGLLFKADSMLDLKRVMLNAINNYPRKYQDMKARLASHVEKEYSSKEILKKYLSMFDDMKN